MDIRGTWKLVKIMTRDENLNIVWKTVEDYLADPNIDEDFKKGVEGGKLIIDDQYINFAMKIPEGTPQEEIDEAIASGELTLLDDNYFAVDKKEWKEVDGTFKFNSGAKGEILGEAIDPWEPIKFTDDGLLEMLVNQYEKV